MGYNELIQNAVEGGLVGLILWIGFLISLLVTPLKNNKPRSSHKNTEAYEYVIIAYAGVVVFIVMSLLNFTIQAIPVMCLFIVYASILSVSSPDMSFNFKSKGIALQKIVFVKSQTVTTKWIYSICFIMVGIVSMYKTVLFIQDNIMNKRAALFTKQGNYRASLNILATLSPHLDSYESYWTNYGNTLFANGEYSKAIEKYNKAKLLTSNPINYTKLAQCYEKVGEYKYAQENFLIAEYIEPNHLTPRFALMNLYLKTNDTVKSVIEAQKIMDIVPKIQSDETRFYKYQANILLKKRGVFDKESLPKKWPLTKSIYFPHKNI